MAVDSSKIRIGLNVSRTYRMAATTPLADKRLRPFAPRLNDRPVMTISLTLATPKFMPCLFQGIGLSHAALLSSLSPSKNALKAGTTGLPALAS
jgi:hypothetical protein